VAYSQQFNAAAFTRSYGWPAKDFLKINGMINLIIGPITVIGIGALADYWRKRGQIDAPLRLLVLGYLVMLPASTAAMLMPTPVIAFAVLALSSVGIGTVTSAAIIALLDITPSAVRGQIVALYYMAISISGLLLGPTTVGYLSTRVYGEANLKLAIATVPLLFGIIPLLLMPIITKTYRAELDDFRAHAA